MLLKPTPEAISNVIIFAQSCQYLGIRTNAGTYNPVPVLTGEYLCDKSY